VRFLALRYFTGQVWILLKFFLSLCAWRVAEVCFHSFKIKIVCFERLIESFDSLFDNARQIQNPIKSPLRDRQINREFTKPRRQRQPERHWTKELTSGTMAVHVRCNSWYISLPSSARQQCEMTKFALYGERQPPRLIFFNFYFKFIAVSRI